MKSSDFTEIRERGNGAKKLPHFFCFLTAALLALTIFLAFILDLTTFLTSDLCVSFCQTTTYCVKIESNQRLTIFSYRTKWIKTSPKAVAFGDVSNTFNACRTENLPEKEKWNRADFAFSARFPRHKRHFQAENVQKIHVPEHHTILRFAAYLFLAQGSPGLRTTTGAANLEAIKPYYNGGIQNGQVHF